MNTPNDRQNGQSGKDEPERGPLDERIQVAAVRALLAQHRARKSLRKLADEVGVSKSTIDDLVKDFHNQSVREPKQPFGTWPKLRLWYLKTRQEAGTLGDFPEDMAMLFQEAVAHLPEPEQEEALRRLIATLGEIDDTNKVPHPAWLQQLRSALAPPPEDEKKDGATDG